MIGQNKNNRKRGAERGRQPKGPVDRSFRRNNAVMSRSQKEIEQRKQSITQRQLELKRKNQAKKRRARVIILTLIVVLFLSIVRFRITGLDLMVLDDDNLTPIAGAGESINGPYYESKINAAISDSSILRQSWSLDRDRLEDNLSNSMPEVGKVEVKTKNPLSTKAKVNLQFRTPVYRIKDVSGQSRYIDDNGVIFDFNYYQIPDKDLILVDDRSGLKINDDNYALNSGTLDFIGVLGDLRSVYGNNSIIEQIIIPKSTREVRVYIKDKSYYLKLSTKRQLNDQISELKLLEDLFKRQKRYPNEYVDLRVEHKAFYK